MKRARRRSQAEVRDERASSVRCKEISMNPPSSRRRFIFSEHYYPLDTDNGLELEPTKGVTET